ncbi:MAG TPA: HD domain-containing phosphohydrolase, partial [Rugosimonospora sp.]|nr:HD domain-containing phosphohydrolase [Rugosimonospora sp.]
MRERVAMAGVVAALSVTSDLTRGHPQGEAMRACLLATELARGAGLDRGRVSDVYYATLLRFAGCAATSHELAAALGGDDIVVRARGDLIDSARPAEGLRLLAGLGEGVNRLRMLSRAPGMARLITAGLRADCEVGVELTRRLYLPEPVSRAVAEGFERFDGRGAPNALAGTDIAEAARYAAVGFAAVMFDAVGGAALAEQMVARWSGRALDPGIAGAFSAAPAELLRMSNPDDLWAAVVEAEPEPRRTFRDEAALDEALAGFGDAADLKAPCFHGHSGGVARLARAAAANLPPVDAAQLYRAGLLHDLGRVAVPTGIWERPGPLRTEEWDLVRLHPYHASRILDRSPVLAPLAPLVHRHHERIDGSGYPAGLSSELDPAACLLAAADACHARGQARPHRPALDLAAASRVLSG